MMPFKELLVCVLSVKMLTLWLSLLLFSVSLKCDLLQPQPLKGNCVVGEQ